MNNAKRKELVGLLQELLYETRKCKHEATEQESIRLLEAKEHTLELAIDIAKPIKVMPEHDLEMQDCLEPQIGERCGMFAIKKD